MPPKRAWEYGPVSGGRAGWSCRPVSNNHTRDGPHSTTGSSASRFQAVIGSRDYSHDLLVMKVQMDQICDAVKSAVR
jgi:hypothetical protein